MSARLVLGRQAAMRFGLERAKLLMLRNSLPLLLGSGSPRRREMLEQLGLLIHSDPPAVDETHVEGQGAIEYVQDVVSRKLDATLRRRDEQDQAVCAAICADTIVVVDGYILQKPSGLDESHKMLSSLMGRTHQVLSGYEFWVAHSGRRIRRIVESTVTFRAAGTSEIDWYVASGEGLDKAGAYAVQGLGAVFVERIDGSYSSVVGLPLSELWSDLIREGVVNFHE